VLVKTGTLTAGTPRLVSVTGVGRSEDEVLALAAAAECHSEHPLGAAVVAAARAAGLLLTGTSSGICRCRWESRATRDQRSSSR